MPKPNNPRFYNRQAGGGFNTCQAGGRPTGWAIQKKEVFYTSRTPTERRQVSNGGPGARGGVHGGQTRAQKEKFSRYLQNMTGFYNRQAGGTP
jgi:hypothetical protein